MFDEIIKKQNTSFELFVHIRITSKQIMFKTQHVFVY